MSSEILVPTAQATLVAWLPEVNATFNLLSCVLLVCGRLAIVRGRRVARHQALMLAALSSSSLFLVGYLTRLYCSGTHRMPGTGLIKTFYLVLLGTHMVLAVLLLPLLATVLTLAFRRQFERHRAWARIVWPIWMYVSVTGVVVYGMLYHVAPRLVAP